MSNFQVTAAPYRTKAHTAADALRDAIRQGTLAPGERIDLDRFCTQLGMSVTPVREALRQLEAEGFVISTPHRGVRVANFSSADATALYDLRVHIETYALKRSVPHLTPEDIAELRRYTELHADAVGAKDYAAAAEYNREWHRIAYSRANTPQLDDIITRLWNAFPWTLTWSNQDRLEQSRRGHAEMLEAITAGDAEQASEMLAGHIAEGKTFVLVQLEKEHGDAAGSVDGAFGRTDSPSASRR